MLDLPAAFAVDYPSARAKFREAARACSLAVERHVHPTARGAQDEELSIDVGLLGDARACRLLLVTSGMHGVEGFGGSGCQVALLRDSLVATTLEATKSALLFCHAVNPYGFSHLRRVNEDNVDLNRNFASFNESGAPFPANSGYAEIHDWLLPADWDGPARQAADAKIRAFIAERGERAFRTARGSGQYTHPDGMFFGGTSPTWASGTSSPGGSRSATSTSPSAWSAST